MITETPIYTLKSAKPRVSEFKRIVKVMSARWVVMFGVVILLLFLLTALFAPWLAPYGYDDQNLDNLLAQPSKTHLLGTDELGRDILSRIILGSRISLLVGAVAVTIAGVIGMSMGLLAGYFGGWVNTVIMRLTDTLLALPPIILMLTISAIMGAGLTNVLIALGVGLIPTYCRLMCGQVLSLKENDFIMAADVIGSSNSRIMFRHLFPNAFPPLMVLMTINLGTAILSESALSFLGIGIRPPIPAWGGMVNTGYRYLLSNPLNSLAPGIAILLVVLAFNMVGDGLRDALDPRLRGKI